MKSVALEIRQLIPFPTKLHYEGKKRKEEAQSMRWVHRAQERLLYLNLSSHILDISLITEKMELYNEYYILLDTLKKSALARIKTGQAPLSFAYTLDVRLLKLEEEIVIMTNLKVHHVWGGREILAGSKTPIGALPLEIDKVPAEPMMEFVSKVKKHFPSIIALEYKVRAANAAVKAAKSSLAPDFTLMGGYKKRKNFSDQISFGLGISIPGFFYLGNRGKIKSAEARKESEKQALNAERNHVETLAHLIYHMKGVFHDAHGLYAGRLLESARLASESAMNEFSVSKISFLTLLDIIESEFRSKLRERELMKGLIKNRILMNEFSFHGRS